MPLRRFSDAIGKLYAFAAEFDPMHFPRYALDVLRDLVDIDGGVLGKSGAPEEGVSAKRVMLDQAYVYRRSPALLDEYLDIVEANPAIALRAIHSQTLIDCATHFCRRAQAPLAELTRHHSIRHMLLMSGSAKGSSSTIWVALFRADDRPFKHSELRMLRIVWRHLLQACQANLQQALRAVDPYGSSRPLALVNRRGVLEAASPAMKELLKSEWPDHDGERLALPVVQALIEHGRYRGARIEINASPRYGYLACLARLTPVLHTLSPSERTVAEHYARGLGHKEIASRLKVSPNTVRNQLAHVYQKLGIHSKAELTRSLSSRAAR